jgi:hypothetical protein
MDAGMSLVRPYQSWANILKYPYIVKQNTLVLPGLKTKKISKSSSTVRLFPYFSDSKCEPLIISFGKGSKKPG